MPKNPVQRDPDMKAHDYIRGGAAAFCLVLLFLLSVQTASCSKEAFGGLGIRVGQLYDPQTPDKKGQLVVLYVMEGLPAQKAGVERGDIITHINGEPTEGKDFDELVSTRMRGPAGEKVALTLERYGPAESKTLELSVQRVAIQES